MQIRTFTVRWKEGLHLRAAARLAQAAQGWHSTLLLKCGRGAADLRSILGVIMLCATFGMEVTVEVEGADEEDAVAAIERVFSDGPR